ncbi:MAG: hypothetical protein GY842_03715 [bacterium]|nr:hypothetical protein [bacterium]
MLPTPENHPLKRLFAGLVEDAFYAQMGVCDPELVDYLAGLLAAFTHIDTVKNLPEADGAHLDQLALMLAASLEGEPASVFPREFSVHRHIGDYALFWSGLYPERLRLTCRPTWSDGVRDYVAQGKRSYAIASDLGDPDSAPPSRLLRRLSDEFEACVHGLGLVRRGWEHDEGPEGNTGGELLY